MVSNSNRAKTSEPEVAPHRSKSEEDSLSHMWAVSYSDLLMVLLSFFIVFFDPDSEKKNDRLKIAETFLTMGVQQATSKNQAKTERTLSSKPDIKGAETTPISPKGLAALTKTLSATKVQIASDQRTPGIILIHFDDNFYRAGKFELDSKQSEQLLSILNIIKTSETPVRLSFIGHSDAQPVQALLKQGVLKSNQDLSGIRASRAAEFARKAGFDKLILTSEGFGSSMRNTRSLSIRISEAGAP